MSEEAITHRKEDHIRICLEERVDGVNTTGLHEFRLEYDALPEVDLSDVDLSCEVLGKKLSAPLFIGAITGGTERAAKINANLAKAAEALGIGLCLGSQRAMIEAPDIAHSFDVKSRCPELPLVLGNLGAVQLNMGVTPKQVEAGAERLGLDGVVFHINPLQEAIQPEGDTCFKGLTQRLHDAVEAISLPCLVKEVGSGISARTADKLAKMPLAGVETAGLGGTSWTLVETYRAPGSTKAAAGEALASFGVPTAESILECRRAFDSRLGVASGGIRTGYEAAVELALGADAVATARPVLEAALESSKAVCEVLERVLEGLRVTMFGCGCTKPEELQRAPFARVPEWAKLRLGSRVEEG